MPFAVNFVVFVAVAPFVEELTFRGLGYSLLEPIGRLTAILWVGVAFGLAHGLLEGLPILIVFGCGLAWLRERSDSVYPGMVVHASVQRGRADRRGLDLAGEGSPSVYALDRAPRPAPGSAAARLADGSPRPRLAALTLKAPGATTYLHRIDFAGPAEPGRTGRPRAADARHDARATTRVAPRRQLPLRGPAGQPRPLPRRVALGQVERRHRPDPADAPRVAGRSLVAGAPLRLAATLEPTEAGRVRVQVIRRRPDRLRPQLRRRRPRLARERASRHRARPPDDVPRPGFDRVGRS